MHLCYFSAKKLEKMHRFVPLMGEDKTDNPLTPLRAELVVSVQEETSQGNLSNPDTGRMTGQPGPIVSARQGTFDEFTSLRACICLLLKPYLFIAPWHDGRQRITHLVNGLNEYPSQL